MYILYVWGGAKALPLFYLENERGNAMTLKELIKTLKNYTTIKEELNKEVRFCTLNCADLEFLSIYEEDDLIIIDVGTEEDNDERNSCGFGT